MQIQRGPCTCTVAERDGETCYVFQGPSGEHVLSVGETSTARLAAHWRGFLLTNIPLPVPGDAWDVEANQGTRPGIVIATAPASGHIIVEYTMPGGSTALRLMSPYDDANVSLTYDEARLRFRSELARGIPWAGRAQRVGRTVASRATARLWGADATVVENENGSLWVGRPYSSLAVP